MKMSSFLYGVFSKSAACLFLFVGFLCHSANSSDATWDVLVFSQQWPTTTCVEWKEKMARHTCMLPLARSIWTVHGVWPSKLHSFGPFFCHSPLHFNMSQLQGIEPQLLAYWTNIENGTSTYDFWKHEWKKHGKCALSLPALDSELKYFEQALTWAKQYNMADVLGRAGVIPNTQGYLGQDVWTAVKGVLGTDSVVHCVTDKGEAYLAEVRICFNKSLELTDCDGIAGVATHTNCPPDKRALYPGPSALAPGPGEPLRAPWLLGLLRGLQLLHWATL
ncbi:ribonuclease Oy isoform X2 [Bacillus rossius redtenbacheri]|uniref:ribonuclease Oy isoform X2 n=1 Tax=Bacillus rossius redtenbacheri TaxID=93214 RepID=UPI002FDD1E47